MQCTSIHSPKCLREYSGTPLTVLGKYLWMGSDPKQRAKETGSVEVLLLIKNVKHEFPINEMQDQRHRKIETEDTGGGTETEGMLP